MAYALLILVSTLIVLAYFYMTRKFNYWKERGVAFVRPLPFVGNFGDIFLARRSASQILDSTYNNAKDQPYVGLFALDQPILLIQDPEVIKNVLVKDFNYFSDRNASAGPHDPMGFANLFVLKNPSWKYVRSKLSPIFTSGRLKLMFGLMLEIARDLDTHMNALNLKGEGKPVEFQELSAAFTTDLISMTALGLKVNSLNDPDAEFRKNGKKAFSSTYLRGLEFSSIFFKPSLVAPLGLVMFTKDGSEFFRKALWSTLLERERNGQKKNDLIDLLIELKKSDAENPGEKLFEFKGDNLVAQAAVFFNAGFDTSSTLLHFALYEMAVNPEIQTRARNEINTAIEKNNGEITYDMMNQLTYTQMILFETLRKYPPLPFLDRIAIKDYQIPGHDLMIEKGTPIFIPMSGIQRDSKYHKDPEKFDPERFSDDNKDSMKFTYLPFGEGPRSCIGSRMGLLQAKLGFVKLISQYELTPCKETNIPVRFSKKIILTHPESGNILHVRKIVN